MGRGRIHANTILMLYTCRGELACHAADDRDRQVRPFPDTVERQLDGPPAWMDIPIRAFPTATTGFPSRLLDCPDQDSARFLASPNTVVNLSMPARSLFGAEQPTDIGRWLTTIAIDLVGHRDRYAVDRRTLGQRVRSGSYPDRYGDLGLVPLEAASSVPVAPIQASG
jgi:hypothetical protein